MNAEQRKRALALASVELGKMLAEVMDKKFGKGTTAYCLILTTVGHRGSTSLKTNIQSGDLANVLQEIVDQMRGKESRIITLH